MKPRGLGEGCLGFACPLGCCPPLGAEIWAASPQVGPFPGLRLQIASLPNLPAGVGGGAYLCPRTPSAVAGGKAGPRAPLSPGSGMWSKRGHRGRGRAARTWRGAGPRRWLEVAGACFRGSGSPPGSQPPAKPPPPLQRGSPPPLLGNPTPLTWLGCSACSEDAIFLRPD